ncbi:MAG: DUF1549 and DUF1553 domain-containing protein [Planctomycetales bacterium]|nr:DUF1549 and DUF1553 domain-containing protein [Planctomycetales bacterium]
MAVLGAKCTVEVPGFFSKVTTVLRSATVLLLLATTSSVARGDEVVELATEIDGLIRRRLAAENVTAAPAADDAEFLRRVFLDLGGRIPPSTRVRRFLADRDPDKRRKVVDELLDSSLYVVHFSNVWRKALLPETQADPQTRVLVPAFEAWLRQKLTDDTSYSEMVREIVTVPLAASRNPREIPGQADRPSPLAFYQAKQIKPENLAASTARTFLGIRIECAQCHDHPFDNWKQNDFWSFAAFFAGMERQGRGGFLAAIREVADRRKLKIPGTETSVGPVFLDGSRPLPTQTRGARQLLADWMITVENSYFAKAAVNRLWSQMFGIGLVDPPDDFTADNPPSHPKLLDLLASEFASHNFDVRHILRSIVASDAYQRTSRQTDPSQQKPRLFSRMAVKGLSPEQIFDSLAQATGYVPAAVDRTSTGPGALDSVRSEFVDLFGDDSSRPTQQRTTILQALALMNGGLVSEATSLDRSRTLTAVVEFPALGTGDRVEALFLAALGRRPGAKRLAALVAYVDAGGVTKDPAAALADVFWALLNSSEFLLNH